MGQRFEAAMRFLVICSLGPWTVVFRRVLCAIRILVNPHQNDVPQLVVPFGHVVGLGRL